MPKTEDHYLCGDCGYEGPVHYIPVTDMVPYGEGNVPMYVQTDHTCPECEGYNVEEI